MALFLNQCSYKRRTFGMHTILLLKQFCIINRKKRMNRLDKQSLILKIYEITRQFRMIIYSIWKQVSYDISTYSSYQDINYCIEEIPFKFKSRSKRVKIWYVMYGFDKKIILLKGIPLFKTVMQHFVIRR